MHPHRIRAIIVLAIAASACKEGTAPPVPTSVVATSTTPSATAGLTLSTTPTFSVKDAGGNTLGGVGIAVAVTAGGGTLSGVPTTTLSGAPTPIGTWTLGKTAGLNTVTITVGALAPLVISVTGAPGPPTSIAVISGAGQAAFAGTIVGNSVVASLRDQFNNGVPGAVITFAVIAGGGSITPATVVADANGNATGGAWRLGKSAIAQVLSITGGGFSASAAATTSTAFDIDLRFFGPPMPSEAAAAFTDAAARIRAAITGDILDVDFPIITANQGIDITVCGPTGVLVNELVDDLIIYATVVSIDGPGKVLASAGPCIRRSAITGGFAVVGVMRFDADDIGGLITSGRLNDVILHEMMHVVGFGTNWSAKSLLQAAGSSDPRFTGPSALGACSSLGGSLFCAAGVPVENTGGPGTADAHWRESIFDAELMTGFVEAPGIPMPFSNVTLQQFADEGYFVNPGATDPFLLNGGPVPLRGPSSNLMIGGDGQSWEIVAKPLLEVSRAGGVRRLTQQ